MRIILARLLFVSCFIFLSSHVSVKAESSRLLKSVSSLNNTTEPNNSALNSWKCIEDYILQLSFFTDDDENECSSIKKKTPVTSNSIFTNNSFTSIHSTGFANLWRFNKHFCYPSLQRYILHRIIII